MKDGPSFRIHGDGPNATTARWVIRCGRSKLALLFGVAMMALQGFAELLRAVATVLKPGAGEAAMSPELLTIGMFGALLTLNHDGRIAVLGPGWRGLSSSTLILSGTNRPVPNNLGSVRQYVVNPALGGAFLRVSWAWRCRGSKISENLYQAFYLWSGRVNGGLLLGTAGAPLCGGVVGHDGKLRRLRP